MPFWEATQPGHDPIRDSDGLYKYDLATHSAPRCRLSFTTTNPKMKFITVLTSMAALVAAAPAVEPTKTQSIDKRATNLCGQWDNIKVGSYIIYNNLWGRDQATSGSQCTLVDGITNNLAKWSSTWSWAGGNLHVKSYSNAVLQAPAARVSAVASIPSKWQWIRGMIWLAALGGAGPISATGKPIATVTISGVSWQLYKGAHSQMTVFSFVATKQQTNYSGDVADFIKYLTASQGLPGSQCLYSIGAGTEPFVGTNAKFDTTGYSVSLSTAAAPAPKPATTTAAAPKPAATTAPSKPATGATCAPAYGQCGGQGWTGPTCCTTGTCKVSNQWYSQCS
ncbi:endoglucanase-1 [Verticillium alfalfae VaMs.102]|uniref:Endoglucanase-1 n=1 Tax=Verticillium alfalfae (strain VaMs.102 / ATCC MYA-4576 / FGSC 10136) TaxID=526221 RepID=C9SWH4_VERA1|nr:endoglucanase-1 [Verticillium alfalfae VaMs.102]EEY23139.1 endoglucanase-1 [Verticillium alfalfae VaMs.102]